MDEKSQRKGRQVSSREELFARIKKAVVPVQEAGKATAYPQWDGALARSVYAPEDDGFATKWARFTERLAGVHGTVLEGYAALAGWLKENDCTFGYIDPVVEKELQETGLVETAFAGLSWETTFARARIDAYRFGLTRAAGAIAETGTLIFKDTVTSARLAALAPWVHAAVLRPEGLYADVGEALGHLGDDPSIIFATGPSKTADVEGILIEGVHGPGVQIACLVQS